MNTKRKSLSAVHLDLYSILCEGRDKATQLEVLSDYLGISERKVRSMIEDLTANGMVVCNLQNGKGYYKPATDEDYEAALKLNASRLHSLLRKDYAIKKARERFNYNGNSLFVQS